MQRPPPPCRPTPAPNQAAGRSWPGCGHWVTRGGVWGPGLFSRPGSSRCPLHREDPDLGLTRLGPPCSVSLLTASMCPALRDTQREQRKVCPQELNSWVWGRTDGPHVVSGLPRFGRAVGKPRGELCDPPPAGGLTGALWWPPRGGQGQRGAGRGMGWTPGRRAGAGFPERRALQGARAGLGAGAAWVPPPQGQSHVFSGRLPSLLPSHPWGWRAASAPAGPGRNCPCFGGKTGLSSSCVNICRGFLLTHKVPLAGTRKTSLQYPRLGCAIPPLRRRWL